MKVTLWVKSVIISILILFQQAAYSESFVFKMKVNVIERSCDIYGEEGNGQPIIVEFNEININKFNDERYEKEIKYNLDCGKENERNPKLKIIFKSDTASFDNNLIATSRDSLGLKLMANGKLLAPYQWYPFDYNKKPMLTVKLMIDPKGTIEYGPFKSSGILSVEYE